MIEHQQFLEEANQNNRKPEKQSNRNEFVKDKKSKLYLTKSCILQRDRKLVWLSSIKDKTIWDWLKLIFAPALIALIAGAFTIYTNTKQNQLLEQREKAAKNRSQQNLLVEYLGEISGLVEKQMLTLNNNNNSKTQRTIARARTLSVLRALDGYRKGELIQFLSTAKLIERNQSVIDLSHADIVGAYLLRVDLDNTNFENANLERAYIIDANLKNTNWKYADLRSADLTFSRMNDAYLVRATLSFADLTGVNLENANLKEADLVNANLEYARFNNANLENVRLNLANLRDANFETAKNLDATAVKSACNWEQAKFSKKFIQRLTQEPDQNVYCGDWKNNRIIYSIQP